MQSFQEAGGGELHKVAIADVAGREQREVVALDAARSPRGVVVHHVDLAAEDRLDVVLRACLVQLHHAVHDAVVGETEGRLVELGGSLCQILDPACAVEQRVLGVDVQMGAGLASHRG